MDLENSFVVPADLATTWTTLLDIEGVASCVLGVTVTSVDADCVAAVIRVKLGPVTMAYEGVATVLSADEATHSAVIEGCGRETRGAGTARALLTMQLVAQSEQVTRVDVQTQLVLTGKAAQFGAGVLADASRRVVDLFAGNLVQVMSERSGRKVAT